MNRNVSLRARSLLFVIRPFAACILIACCAPRAVASISLAALQARAEKGDIKQEIQLAQAYLMGDGVSPDPAKAAHWYLKAAGGGNPDAENMAGYLYESGVGVPSDQAAAMRWYQLAAASGSADAVLNIGVLYLRGLGVHPDPERAAEYFHRAVDKGNGTGATYLGTLYHLGQGVPQDDSVAEQWYGRGEKMGDPISSYNLGILYSEESNHPHDLPRAAKYLRKSANAEYVPGKHSLAVLLVKHPELAHAPDEALRAAQFAAQAGYWRSSVLLGILYRDGRGVVSDAKLASFHFNVAMLQGGKPVEDLLRHDMQALAASLGPQQTQAIAADAGAWFQQHPPQLAMVHVKGSPPKFFSEPPLPDRAGAPQNELAAPSRPC